MLNSFEPSTFNQRVIFENLREYFTELNLTLFNQDNGIHLIYVKNGHLDWKIEKIEYL